MINRYSKKTILKNDLEIYKDAFYRRNLKFIKHYETAKFNFPNVEEMKNINTVKHIWSIGDRYYKLASKYYNDPKDWWIIALFNNKPTESDIMLGDEILIPLPLENVIRYLK